MKCVLSVRAYQNVADLTKVKFPANDYVIVDKLEEANIGTNFFGYSLPFAARLVMREVKVA